MLAAQGCDCGLAPACAQSAATDAVVPPDEGYLVRRIGDALYWITDGAYSTMFMVSDDGVIACDAPPSLGERYLAGIREVTDKTITHLVYSHEHWDHIAGSGAFPAGIEIVAHRTTAELLRSRNDRSRRRPTLVYDRPLTLGRGERRLELSYQGINHSIDNTYIYAPQQKALMLIDVIYPGWMPYKNLGVAVDVPGFVDAHRKVLGYDFEVLVAGHVSRPGTRQDVLVQIELLKDLAAAAARAYRRSFPAFLRDHPPGVDGKAAWDLHNDYETELVDGMVAELEAKWSARLAGSRTYLRDNCWAMLESYVVQGAPNLSFG
jgi:glyoxylase-like metal-dependent hydrolase (beta-lactamase superfamily II)